MPCKNHPSVEGPLWQCSRCGELFCADCVVQIGGRTLCATCKAETMRDLRAGVPTGYLELATLGSRFAALLLDFIIVYTPLTLIMVAFMIPTFALAASDVAPDPTPIFFILQMTLGFGSIAVWILYEGLMLERSGQTLGKKVLKIKVVTPEGHAITRKQAFLRAGIRQLFYMFCFIVDYVTVFGQDRTCIHDQAAKTRVVVVRD